MTPINEKEISLFRLKSELVELMQFRDDAEHAENCNVNRIRTNEPASARACNCEVAAIDGQIKAYLTAELRKVDNVRAYLRHCEMMQEAAADEVKRLSALGHTWKGRRERLLEVCRELMLEFREKRLEGLHGSIILKGNGGLQALEMGNPGLIPEELCEYRGSIASKCWTQILVACDLAGIHPAEWEGVRMERTPVNSFVRNALTGNCSVCGGAGGSRAGEPCTACGGSGKATVPGARLAERGVHVEVR